MYFFKLYISKPIKFNDTQVWEKDGKTHGPATMGMQFGSVSMAKRSDMIMEVPYAEKIQSGEYKDLRDAMADTMVNELDRIVNSGSLNNLGANTAPALKEILDLYSKSLVYMGISGSGQLTKMVNQICVATIIQGLAEGLNFAKKKKLNVDSLIKVLKNGAGQSWQLENRAKTMWKSEFNFGFMNKLMLKDLDIIIKEINQSDIKLPVTKIIKNNYQKLIKLGFAKEDTSNLIRLLM